MNICALLEANESVQAAVHLRHQEGSHQRKKKVDAERWLSDAMIEWELHKFHPGCNLGHEVQDDFEKNYEMLENGKRIQAFVHRTLLAVGFWSNP